jgi:hypothetical protein
MNYFIFLHKFYIINNSSSWTARVRFPVGEGIYLISTTFRSDIEVFPTYYAMGTGYFPP